MLKVYQNAGPSGTLLSQLSLTTYGSSNDKLAFSPSYPTSTSSTYYFNLGDLISGIGQNNPCTVFESKTGYPRVSPVRSVGADGVGNRIGRTTFGKQTYTFWITYNQGSYIPPHSGSNDWELQIMCAM